MKNVPKRHGDMLLLKVDKSFIQGMESKKRSNLTVGLGEVTGHYHNIKPFEGGTVLEYAPSFEDEDTEEFIQRDETFFEVKGSGGFIHHQEHDPIIIEPGIYKRVIQRVYDPFAEKIRQVRD